MTTRPEACPACGALWLKSYSSETIHEYQCGVVFTPHNNLWSGHCSRAFDSAVRLRAELKRIADRTTDQWAQAVARNALEGQG